jgi:alkylhydroperoxidase family enzyme
MANGMYPEPVSTQVVANSPQALAAMHQSYAAVFGKSALGGRIQELVRIRSTQFNGCDLCAAARKDETIDTACEAALPDDPREAAAVRLLQTMVCNHHAIDDDVLRDLARHFSEGEIVGLGRICGNYIVTHRFSMCST